MTPRSARGTSARLRLFCWPYAGKGASIFRDWPAGLADWSMDVVPVQLPGREDRFEEPAFRRLPPLIDTLARSLRSLLRPPFAFFGHSMGALIAFELTRRLRAERLPGPTHLFVSAARPPDQPRSDEPMSTESDDALLATLGRLDGIPDEVVRNRELRELVLPTLRADIALCESYLHSAQEPLSCPITALGGLDDKLVSQEQLAGWGAHTRGRFQVHGFPGGHFYLHSAHHELLLEIGKALAWVAA